MSEVNTKIFYKGSVSLKVKINGKLYELQDHNAGLDYLFYMFAVFMTGNFNSSTMVIKPSYLDLRRAEYVSPGVFLPDTTYLRYLPSISAARYYQESGKWYAEFTSTLNAEALLDTINSDDSSEYFLYLITEYDNNNASERYHDIAKLQVTTNVLAQLTPGIVATVVWTMQLENPSS